ncbi:hypothetical protein ACSFA2_24685 [Variovorax sp. LT2P21]|uniref:hypothetical protein n=1 Tax=Variovorax sp. LT2P21 TaxID=3443731 RepID=UPI003F4768C2
MDQMMNYLFILSRLLRCMTVCTIGVLVGCASPRETSSKYTLDALDSSKGIIVGSVYERAVFLPHGAYFSILSPQGERIVIASKPQSKESSILLDRPSGRGNTFALQLPPGKYQVTGWALDYGSLLKRSRPLERPLEFEVIAGQVRYLGRFDANRFSEVASIDDQFSDDLARVRKLPGLAAAAPVNAALDVKGWALP